MNSSNTDWAWPWWTVIVAINVINLIICAIVYKRSLDPNDGVDAIYRKRMRIMGLIFVLVGAYRAVFVYITLLPIKQAWLPRAWAR